jgi:nitrite reductase/ring-hydroxylating ferredoxin subunit
VSEPEQTEGGMARRTLLRGAAVGALSLPLLEGCGLGTPGIKIHQTHRLVKAKHVPVGGGLVLASQLVVVTQPKSGEFKGFTAICSHRHCLLGTVSNGAVHCPCHGSAYSIVTGVNVRGPLGRKAGSVKPLAKVPVKLAGTEVVRAGPTPTSHPSFLA